MYSSVFLRNSFLSIQLILLFSFFSFSHHLSYSFLFLGNSSHFLKHFNSLYTPFTLFASLETAPSSNINCWCSSALHSIFFLLAIYFLQLIPFKPARFCNFSLFSSCLLTRFSFSNTIYTSLTVLLHSPLFILFLIHLVFCLSQKQFPLHPTGFAAFLSPYFILYFPTLFSFLETVFTSPNIWCCCTFFILSLYLLLFSLTKKQLPPRPTIAVLLLFTSFCHYPSCSFSPLFPSWTQQFYFSSLSPCFYYSFLFLNMFNSCFSHN